MAALQAFTSSVGFDLANPIEDLQQVAERAFVHPYPFLGKKPEMIPSTAIPHGSYVMGWVGSACWKEAVP